MKSRGLAFCFTARLGRRQRSKRFGKGSLISATAKGRISGSNIASRTVGWSAYPNWRQSWSGSSQPSSSQRAHRPLWPCKQATSTIPIVFAGVADAVGAGLISNFARPGGNITGFTSISAELSGKRLELLKAVVPNVSRVAVLYNPTDQSNLLIWREFQASAPALALTLQPLPAKEPSEFEPGFIAMARERADALFGTPGVLTFEHRKMLVDLAAKQRIPAMWGHRQFIDVGGLTSYAVNFYDQCRRAALYVEHILKGISRRTPGAATDEVRVHHQPQDRGRARTDHPAFGSCPCRRGHRIACAGQDRSNFRSHPTPSLSDLTGRGRFGA